MDAIKESYDSCFDPVVTMFDGGTSNRKSVRLKAENCAKDEMTFKVPTYFTFNDDKIHILFCIVHIIKRIRNNLISNGNFFIIHYQTFPMEIL